MSVNANMTGNVAIKTVPDGRYLQLRDDDKGLEFREQKINDRAKFTVKQGSNNDFQLISMATKKYVNMYYTSGEYEPEESYLLSISEDVKCEGDSGGVNLRIILLPDGQCNLTISGYQGQDGRTAWLSSNAGNASFNGSLRVQGFEDVTCRFTVENL